MTFRQVRVGTVVMMMAIHLQVNYIKAYAKQEFNTKSHTLILLFLFQCAQNFMFKGLSLELGEFT